MKKLEISAYTSNTVGFPVKEGTWDFLQLAYQEGLNALARQAVGTQYDPTVVYRLWGVDITDDGGDNYSNTEGAVYYNGEIYIVPAGGPVFMDNGPYFQIVKTQYTTNADPVIFTDAGSHNVHNIYTLQLINDNTKLPAPVDISVGWQNGTYSVGHPEIGVVTGGGSISSAVDALNRFKIIQGTAIWNVKSIITVSGSVDSFELINPQELNRNFLGGRNIQLVWDGDPTLAFATVDASDRVTVKRYDAGNLGVGVHGVEFQLIEELV